MVKNLLLSKKVLVTLVGLLAAILAQSGIVNLTPEALDTITTAIIAIVGSFNVGQGIADGLSKGQTSARR